MACCRHLHWVVDVGKDEGVGVGVREGRGERRKRAHHHRPCRLLVDLIPSLLFSCRCLVIFILLLLLTVQVTQTHALA